MSRFNEPKTPLTSARVFDKKSDAELADWLDTDAQAMDGQPGRNNHVAATRAAAERLRRLSEHDAKVRAEALREAYADLEAYTDSGAPFGHRPVEEFLLHRADRIEREAGL